MAELEMSGARFRVVYQLFTDGRHVEEMARDICVEQTVEFPDDLIGPGRIRDHIFGRVESICPQPLQPPPGRTAFEVVISYAVETVGAELTQLLNVVFGNISIKPDIRVERLELGRPLNERFAGPRFGIAGLRSLLGVETRPMLCTALKPMGLSARELASLAHDLALGGVDIIKDDHGLTDQPFCRFQERVVRCARAVRSANEQTRGRCLYVPNVTAPVDEVFKRVDYARAAGAGGLLIAPGLTGFDTMRCLAAADNVALPILCHPALLGSFVLHPTHGISHEALFGQLVRLAGADATIFPSYGGRFSFSRAQCVSIVRGATGDMGRLKPIFVVPAGGMTLSTVPEMLAFYGLDIMLLIGGDLHRSSAGVVERCRQFRRLAEEACRGGGSGL